MKYQNGGVLINAMGLQLSPVMWRSLRRKIGAIFRRNPSVLGVRVDLKRDVVGEGRELYTARTRLVLPGYDRYVEKRGEHLPRVISRAMDVANRQLRKRATALRRQERNG